MITWDCTQCHLQWLTAQCHLQCLTKGPVYMRMISNTVLYIVFSVFIVANQQEKTSLHGHCCGHWNYSTTNARLSARCDLIMKTVPSKLVNTGTFAWTKDEVGSLLHVGKSEQHKQNSAMCHIMAHTQKQLILAIHNVLAPIYTIAGVSQIPRSETWIQTTFVSEETSAVVMYINHKKQNRKCMVSFKIGTVKPGPKHWQLSFSHHKMIS